MKTNSHRCIRNYAIHHAHMSFCCCCRNYTFNIEAAQYKWLKYEQNNVRNKVKEGRVPEMVGGEYV